MKKIIAILFTVMLTFGLCACGNGEEVVVDESTGVEKVVSNSNSNYLVEITGYEVKKDYEGKDSLAVYFTWTNNSEETVNYWTELWAEAFQDGIGLDKSFPSVSNESEYELYENEMTDIRPGNSIDGVFYFVLNNQTSDVEIEISEYLTDTILATDLVVFE